MNLLQWCRRLVVRTGFDVVRVSTEREKASTPALIDNSIPAEMTPHDLETVRTASAFSMTSPARLCSLVKAVHYVTANKIPGAIVECGVWKGGSMLAAARTLIADNDNARDLYLFDTFEGMPPPSNLDVDHAGVTAQSQLDTSSVDGIVWAKAQLDLVKKTMSSSGYEERLIHYVKGKVEETIPLTLPNEIAILRLDTDWYESTRHELQHLFPKLCEGGVLIIDDYGHWQGARRAVDEYFATHKPAILLNSIDYTGRIGIKIGVRPERIDDQSK